MILPLPDDPHLPTLNVLGIVNMLSPYYNSDPPSPSPSPRSLRQATFHMTTALPAAPTILQSTSPLAFSLCDGGNTASSRVRSMASMSTGSAAPAASPSKRKDDGKQVDQKRLLDGPSPVKKSRASKPTGGKRASQVGTSSSASPVASTSRLTLLDDEPLAALDLASVLCTPRRGRRMGGVNMGWDSPLVDADEDDVAGLSFPHTLPKATRIRKSPYGHLEQPESPSKKKASSRAFHRDPTQPQRTLVDTHGWASAAMISKVPLTDLLASPGFSPRATATPRSDPAASVDVKVEAKSCWTQFNSPITPSTPRLVPLEVAGLGRVAVHRELAGQITEQGPYNKPESSNGFRRHNSFGSDYASGVSDASCTGSSLGTSTNPTSVGTPCPGGVSPSFSLSSQFPPSEPDAPRKRTDVSKAESEAPPMPAPQTTVAAVAQGMLDNALYRPKLGGSHAMPRTGLPTLDWPDAPTGPWAAAGQHIEHLKQQRKEGIEKWLESDLDDEAAASGAESANRQHLHHPMVAKALLDRARKQGQQILSAAHLAAASSPTKRARGAKQSKTAGQHVTTPSRRGRKGKKCAITPSTDSPASRRSVATAASLASSDRSAVRGCKCGIEDESIVMVQCDHCRRWLHLPCVGIASVNDLDDEWYCDECCERAITEHLSPASSLPTTIASFTDLSTPEGLQAAINMCEPVFALPSGTPIHRRGVAVSSSIALAPSPPMLSVAKEPQPSSSSTKRQVAGRSRAERVGWRMNEPGSPLARKSTTASGGARHVGPETPSRSAKPMHDLADVATTPSLLAGFTRSDWEPTRNRADYRPTTPSPRLAGLSTPSRWASERKASHAGGAFSIGLSEDDHPSGADVFSTPSRLSSGGVWGLSGYPGSQTPSRSLRGHSRMDSFSGGLSTPGRDLLAAGSFGAEPTIAHSAGMSTIAFSGSSIDGDDHFGDGGYSLNRAWQMHSPTSSTRAARSRQLSGYATPSSSSLLRTPELQPRRPSTSSLRGSRYDLDDPPTSSSPFPRTPTFDGGSPRYGGPADRNRHAQLGLGLPPPTSASRLSKVGNANATALSSSYNANSAEARDRANAGLPASTGKTRQVSSEMPFGLGIGLDLDDVLDWS